MARPAPRSTRPARVRLPRTARPGREPARRGASIARRLQDPLAELVKIDPKSIGVGQYQHDVNQSELARTLDAVVEDCVNSVGVDLNTASAAAVARVGPVEQRWPPASCAGAMPTARSRTASSCWTCRAWAPRPSSRRRALRIRDGDNPLDLTGVHPETYPVVERSSSPLGRPIGRADGPRRRAPQAQARGFRRREVRRHHRRGHPGRA